MMAATNVLFYLAKSNLNRKCYSGPLNFSGTTVITVTLYMSVMSRTSSIRDKLQ